MNRLSPRSALCWGVVTFHFVLWPATARAVLTTVALSGGQAAGLPAGISYQQMGAGDLSSDGRMSVWASLAGEGINPSNDEGLWMGTPGALSLAVREGDAAPGTAGAIFSNNFLFNLLMDHNTVGHMIVASGLAGPGVDATNNYGIWRGTPGNLSLVARKGDPAPGISPGVNFTDLQFWGWNSARDRAIVRGFLTGPNVTADNNVGFWLLDQQGMTLLVRKGDQALGTSPGVTFGTSEFFRSTVFSLDNNGRVAFSASLIGPDVSTDNDGGIWLHDSNGTVLVVREGDAAPGAEPGATFTVGRFFPVLNDNRQIAFRGGLAGPNINSLNNEGIWIGPPDNLTIAVRDGQVAPGTSVPFTGFTNYSLNNAGEIAFSARIATVTQAEQAYDKGLWLVGPEGSRLIAREGFPAPDSGGWVFNEDFQNNSFPPAINSAGQIAFTAGIQPFPSSQTTSVVKGLYLVDDSSQQRIVTTGDVLAGKTVASFTFLADYFNDLGQLVVNVTFEDGSYGAFLYSPSVPEPSTLALAGFAVLSLLRKPRRFA